MRALDTIAKAYGQNIIDAVKETSITADALQLSDSNEVIRGFSKQASALSANESLHILPLDKNELRGFDKKSLTIGTHPDFKALEEGGDQFHYAVNVFVDIKGSTSLALNLELRKVKQFKDEVIKTAIHIFQAFGGHIHRIQGDAVYAVFCWKGIKKSDSIIAALNATSLLNYTIEINNSRFMEVFETSLAIRTGVDFGDDNNVLWSKYGISGCSEVTTTSLHTDLACKMQQQAGDNEIMIGRNIQTFLDLPSEFYKNVTPNVLLKYKYSMMSFDWHTYLGRFPANPAKIALLHQPIAKRINISCKYYDDPQQGGIQYAANTKALDKDKFLQFELHGFARNENDQIIWRVKNRGNEATANGKLSFEMTDYKNKMACWQYTRYTGHHYMVCEIYSNGRLVAEEYFGIFINDN